jgi:hypothetical protein
MSDHDKEAAIIINDLDSLTLRIEMLETDTEYTNALIAVQNAKEAMIRGRAQRHAARLKAKWG